VPDKGPLARRRDLGELGGHRCSVTYATGLALVAATALCRRRRYRAAGGPSIDAPVRTDGEQDFDFSIGLLIAGIERCLRARRRAGRVRVSS